MPAARDEESDVLEDPGHEEPDDVARDREEEVGRGGQEACAIASRDSPPSESRKIDRRRERDDVPAM